jgi:hypothetical protein
MLGLIKKSTRPPTVRPLPGTKAVCRHGTTQSGQGLSKFILTAEGIKL